MVSKESKLNLGPTLCVVLGRDMTPLTPFAEVSSLIPFLLPTLLMLADTHSCDGASSTCAFSSHSRMRTRRALAQRDEQAAVFIDAPADLVPGTYEGRLKMWDCTLDLAVLGLSSSGHMGYPCHATHSSGSYDQCSTSQRCNSSPSPTCTPSRFSYHRPYQVRTLCRHCAQHEATLRDSISPRGNA